MDYQFQQAVEVLRASRHVVVFTGAGVSAESGIPTFRDDEGFWRRFPIDQFGNWKGLLKTAFTEPRRLAEYVSCVLGPIAEAEPNAAHRAIAEAGQSACRVTVVTQNIDGLHQRAGSNTVFEIHGTLFSKCGLRGEPRGELSVPQMQRASRRIAAAQYGLFPLLRLLLAMRPLLGVGLRGAYRPALVMFGDALAQPAWGLARRAVEDCDCLVQIGTSGVVYPAAALPDLAATVGAATIAIDPEPTSADLWLQGPASEIVPRLFGEAFGGDDATACA